MMNKQRCIFIYLGGLQPKVNAFPLAALGDDVREPHEGVILQSASGDTAQLHLFCDSSVPYP